MLARTVIRTRVALILNLALACLAGSCAEPARIDGRSVADCVEDLGRAGDAQRLAALDTLAARQSPTSPPASARRGSATRP